MFFVTTLSSRVVVVIFVVWTAFVSLETEIFFLTFDLKATQLPEMLLT